MQANPRLGSPGPTARLAAVARGTVTVAVLAVAGCSAPFPSPMAGTVIATEQGAPSPDGRERWVTTIFLDQGQVLGSPDVRVAFWADDLRCDDGEPVPDGPAGLTVGTRLEVDFDPDAPVGTADPPIIDGLSLTASCPPGAGS